MPPAATGVAACSAEAIAALRGEHRIDVYVDEPAVDPAAGLRSAHEFVWRHRLEPYDLTVFQVGNSSHHDYLWPYLIRYPGLTVLHDAHLHHARAAALLRSRRAGDYRAELAWNHPDANPDVAELAVKGFDNHAYYCWPMTRLVVRASRLVAVHTRQLAARLREESPDAHVEPIHLGHGVPLGPDQEQALRADARARYGIPPDAIVVGCFGALIPDKRLPQTLAAFAAIRTSTLSAHPAHLLLGGARAAHYDVDADVARHGLQDCTTVTGRLPTDDDLTACIAAADIVVSLRWPTAREVSGPWLRALAAGKPTVIVDLAHLADVPTLDPRTWQRNTLPPEIDGTLDPCAVAIDILDEDHSLRLALRRLATDPALRTALGTAARDYWHANHTIGRMAADYRSIIDRAAHLDVRQPPLPRHVQDVGMRILERVLEPFGLTPPIGQVPGADRPAPNV
jgi:glycosyltransferase involved in cell wall biosynthesis